METFRKAILNNMNIVNIDIKKRKPSDLKSGPIRHPALPEYFVERVKAYKQAVAEVETSTLESTLENFRRDIEPEAELILWEHIAKIYQWSIVANAGLSLEQKKEVLSVLLGLSMDIKDFSGIKTLTKETVNEIVERYPHI